MGTAHVPSRFECGAMSYSHQMEKTGGILLECHAEGVFGSVGDGGVSVGYVDGDEFSVRGAFQLRAEFFTVDGLAAFGDFLGRRSSSNSLLGHLRCTFGRHHTTSASPALHGR